MYKGFNVGRKYKKKAATYYRLFISILLFWCFGLFSIHKIPSVRNKMKITQVNEENIVK